MMALEELGENEARLLFLTTQRQDIVDSISSTEEALREIKRARARDSVTPSNRLTKTSANSSRNSLAAARAR